jgi:hypothetical protein
VSELVGSVCLGLADLITDAITFARLRSGDVAVPNEGYKAAYAAVLSVGAVTTALSLLYRLRNAHIMRALFFLERIFIDRNSPRDTAP